MRERPEVLLEVLAIAKVDVFGDTAGLRVVVADSALAEVTPVLRSPDFVAEVRAEGEEKPRLILVVEVQRGTDGDKPFTWPLCLAMLHARHRVPVLLLVWVFDAKTARWARGPHVLGRGFALSPVVVGPANLPAVASAAEATEHLELAVLVALTRLGEAAARGADLPDAAAQAEVLRVAEAATQLEDENMKRKVASLLHGAAKEPFRAMLQQFLEDHHMRALEIIREEGREEGRTEGRAEGRAATLLRLLRLRGFVVDELESTRILDTTDTELLDRWLDRVLTAKSLDEVLGE